jgi:hypothetical protein
LPKPLPTKENMTLGEAMCVGRMFRKTDLFLIINYKKDLQPLIDKLIKKIDCAGYIFNIKILSRQHHCVLSVLRVTLSDPQIA